MEIQSKYFGKIEIDAKTIIEMVQPIYGFESSIRYTLLSDQDIGSDLLWFQSIDDEKVCFMVANPATFIKNTIIEMTQDDLELVRASHMDDVDILSIVSLGETFEQSTINLKSPIVLNSKNNVGAQIILNQDLPFKARLV